MSHWKSIAKVTKEIKSRNKKNKENQKFNFIWVISQLFVKIESIYFNYWSETLAIRKQCIFQKRTFHSASTKLLQLSGTFKGSIENLYP